MNYDEMFNVDDIPTSQTSSYSKPPSNNARPPQQQPVKPQHYDAVSGNKSKTIFTCVVAVAILAFIFYTPAGSKDTEKETKPKTESSTSAITTLNSSAKSVSSELVEKVDSSQDMLHWVNYEKTLYKNNSNVLGYYIVCDSPQLGKFETSLTRQEFVDIPDAGIIPLKVTEVIFRGSSEVYYTNFRLHENWKKLLEGNVN